MTSDRTHIILLLFAIFACIVAFVLDRSQLIGNGVNYAIVLAGFVPLLVYYIWPRRGDRRPSLLDAAAFTIGFGFISAVLIASAVVALRIGWLRTWSAAWDTALDVAPFFLFFVFWLEPHFVGAVVLELFLASEARQRSRRRRRGQCPECAFLLKGLDGPICPECGATRPGRRPTPPPGSPRPRGSPRGTSP